MNLKECSLCGSPLIWSHDQRRVWCAVWGDHPTVTPDNVVPLVPGALMVAADAEMYGDNVHPLYARGRVGA